MALEVRLQKQQGRFIPMDSWSAEELDGISDGECVAAKITRPRNLGHHRKFFALIGTVFENQEKHATVGGLLDDVKIGIGHCDWYKIKRGRTIIEYAVPRSINFGNMGQKDFENFYNSAVGYIIAELLKGADKQELEQHVLQIIGG